MLFGRGSSKAFGPAGFLRAGIFGATVLLLGIGSFAQSGDSTPSSQRDRTTGATQQSPGATGQSVTRVAPINESPNQSTPAGPSQTSSQLIGSPQEIQLDEGDLVTIKVFGAPELSDDERVSSTGEIYVSLIGSVHVQGMVPDEAQTAIEDKFREGGFLRDPHVSIFVKEYATAGISVAGEVMKPGIYPLIGAHHLFDAISAAGGTTTLAGKSVTISHHSDPDHPERVTMGGDIAESSSSNVDVFPGDTVVVSKAGIIYVVGDVKTPGGYVMEHNNNMTVLQALALAQGNNPDAALKAAKIVRKGPNGAEEIPVDIAQIEKAKKPDVPMQSNDVLFVPSSTGKNVARRSASTILEIATGLLVYHPL